MADPAHYYYYLTYLMQVILSPAMARVVVAHGVKERAGRKWPFGWCLLVSLLVSLGGVVALRSGVILEEVGQGDRDINGAV